MAQVMVQCNGDLAPDEFVEVRAGDETYSLRNHEAVDIPVKRGSSVSARVVSAAKEETSEVPAGAKPAASKPAA